MSDERSEERVEFTVNLDSTLTLCYNIILRSFAELRSSGAKRSLRAPQRGSELAKSRARSEPRARQLFGFRSIWLAEAERSDWFADHFPVELLFSQWPIAVGRSSFAEGRRARSEAKRKRS